MESPSAMGPGFSNTPQPKPDRGLGPVSGHGTSLNHLPPSGLGGDLDEMPIRSANRTSKISSSTTFDNSSITSGYRGLQEMIPAGSVTYATGAEMLS